MLDSLVDLLTTGGAGSILGIFGGLATKWVEHRKQKQEHAHQVAMRSLDLKELEMEHAQQVMMVDKNIDLAEAEGNITLDKAEIDAFTASMKDGGHWMDIAKSLMRPILTIYVVGLSTYIFIKIDNLIGGLESIPQADLMETYKYIIMQVIFLTVMGYSWWFATRPSSVRRTSRSERIGE